MSRSVNKIILVGTVGQDPEVTVNAEGEPKAWLSLATRRPLGLNQSAPERVDWHRVIFDGRLAGFVDEYVKEGYRIYVEGRLEYDHYEQDGIVVPTADIAAREVVLLSPVARTVEVA
jgi:single-strand DNA-binding protein